MCIKLFLAKHFPLTAFAAFVNLLYRDMCGEPETNKRIDNNLQYIKIVEVFWYKQTIPKQKQPIESHYFH